MPMPARWAGCGERPQSPRRSARRPAAARRRAAATPAKRGVEDNGTRRVDGKQRENGRYRRHHHDAGYDASRARFLQPAAAEPSVAAKSILRKLLMGLLLVVGEE